MNPKIVRTGVVAFVVMLAGCGRKAEEKKVAEQPAAPAPTTLEVVKADERSRHFLAVSKQLELGGTLYGYVDVDGDAQKLAGGLHRLLEQLAKSQPALRPYAKQDLGEIFHLLGFDDIKAAGASSVPDGHGHFRNRTFFYTPEGRHGLLAGLGGKPAPFTYLKLAPANADFYAESEIDLPILYKTIKDVVGKVSGEPAADRFESVLKKAGESAALSVLDLIYGLKGHSALVIRFEPGKTLPLPVPGGAAAPAFSLVLAVDGVGPVLEPLLAKEASLRMTTVGTQHVYEFAQPLPLEGIRPVLVIDGSTLFFATTKEFLTECRAQSTGLGQAPEFQAALAEVGREGNAVAYVHPRFFARLRQLEEINPNLSPDAKATLHMVVENIPTPDRPLVTVRTNLPDGILVRSHWNRSLKQDIAMFTAYNPITVGLLAAMAIPAFQKVRTESQQKAVLNNLRQFSAAGDQFCLENGVDRATYADLVGPDKYVRQLPSVAGEDYTHLVYRPGETLRVRLSSGKVVEYAP